MLEDECHELDTKLAALEAITSNHLDVGKYDEFVQNKLQIHQLKYAIADIDEKIELINESIITQVLHFPEKKKEINQVYEERINILMRRREEKV